MENRKSFTLIELLVVISIIAVLAAVSLPQVIGIVQRAQDVAMKGSMRTIPAEALRIRLAGENFSRIHCDIGGHPDIIAICERIRAQSPHPAQVRSFATARAFCALAPLHDGRTWCIDATGFAGAVSSPFYCSATTHRCVHVAIVAPAPIVTLSATPTLVPSGGTTTLNWDSYGATSCTATAGPGFITDGAIRGSDASTALTAAATFTVSCTGLGGTTTASTTVTLGQTLTVTVTGSGTVTSSPAGISCAPTCSATFAHGTSVTLSPTPAAGWGFSHWTGACTGSGACTVLMDMARSVTAVFAQQTLTVTVTGSGTVTSSPAGINCPGDCTEVYAFGTSVTLGTTPAAGWVFSHWTGACTGSGACTVSMTVARTVGAVFVQPPQTLTVTVSGTGTVTSSPAGISCPPTCSATFAHGTSVTLTPINGHGWTFANWTGDCSGTGTCTVTMTTARSVTAVFLSGGWVFVTSTTHTGNMGGHAGANSICATRAAAAGLFGTFRAWLSSDVQNAVNVVGTGTNGWRRRDGILVASSLADLTDSVLAIPILLNEFQGALPAGSRVLTSTQPSGIIGNNHCNQWTYAGTTQTCAVRGGADQTGGTWTWWECHTCAVAIHIYCFQVH